MKETNDCRGSGGGVSSPDVRIPTGLNRIRTRKVSSKGNLSSKHDDDDKLTESRSLGVSRPLVKPKLKTDGQGVGKLGLPKGKKIARWFTSPFNKNPGQACTKNRALENETFVKECHTKAKLHKEVKQMTKNQSSSVTVSDNKVSKSFKSFSHELGPKGGNPPAQTRVHSYGDLKELLGSLHSRFDVAKETVNIELANFVGDVMDAAQKYDFSPDNQLSLQNILIVAQECMEMGPLDFRAKCDTIVQDLTMKRQQHQPGVLKWLVTRMLFILTRCTRLLRFQKDSEPINEESLNNFKKCLDSIPSVEMSWVHSTESNNSISSHDLKLKRELDYELERKSKVPNLSQSDKYKSKDTANESEFTLGKKSMFLEETWFSHCSRRHKKSFSCGSLHEQEKSLAGSDSVICRICEEVVPTSHLELHSYICAYADKLDFKCPDIDDRLLKLAEVLDLIIESRNASVHASEDSPGSDNVRSQTTNSAFASDKYSPRIGEWRNKGVEEMFEDLHEMDTACIDDSNITNFMYMKGYLGMKLGHSSAPSSSCSMTSASSTNTPRSCHFDFWLEYNNSSELESVSQMTDLADVARCVAGTDVSEEGSIEFLLSCMHDLQEILQHSKLKALVIDTFGRHTENLLREKYILVCKLMDPRSLKNNNEHKKSSKLLVDNALQSSTSTTPLHPFHKERTSIDDFEIIKPISRGAFGKVFLARKRITGDLFAIKVLKKMDMIRKNDIERILAERNILIAVRNPFVVRFFYSFTCRDNLYLVMEYLNGGDLYSLLRKVGCLEEDVSRIYIAELVLALEYLHSLAIVHRDLKPDNILIAHDGHIKLTDFGLSKIGLLNSTVDLSRNAINEVSSVDIDGLHPEKMEDRNPRSAVGTPDYLAPEILLGTDHGYAADWWSVGIILFELITGIPPFTAGCPEVIFNNILNRKIPWPVITTDMSYEAQDLIDRLLIHDPNQRLGANGSQEVKSHDFFKGVNWDTLALQKAAFVPQPESADDTSYFVSRLSNLMSDDRISGDSANVSTGSESTRETDECGDLTDFQSSLNLSLLNFSFKNCAQLAAINYDLLLQSEKDQIKCSSPCKGPNI